MLYKLRSEDGEVARWGSLHPALLNSLRLTLLVCSDSLTQRCKTACLFYPCLATARSHLEH